MTACRLPLTIIRAETNPNISLNRITLPKCQPPCLNVAEAIQSAASADMELAPDKIPPDFKSAVAAFVLSSFKPSNHTRLFPGPHNDSPSEAFIAPVLFNFYLSTSQYMLHHGAGYTRLHLTDGVLAGVGNKGIPT